MRCKACNRLMTSMDFMIDPELCYVCRTVASDPDNSERYTQGVDGIEYFCSDPFIYKNLLDEDESIGDDDG